MGEVWKAEERHSGSEAAHEPAPQSGGAVGHVASQQDSPASGRSHRNDERYPVKGQAEVAVVGDPRGMSVLRGEILDISVSGCFIQTIARVILRPETKVSINFSVRGNVIRALGVSRFSKSKVGIGFRFVKMSEEMQDRLDELIDDARQEWLALPPESRATEHGLTDSARPHRSFSGSADGVESSEAIETNVRKAEPREAARPSERTAEQLDAPQPRAWNPFGI